MAHWVRELASHAECWMFESQQRQTQVVKQVVTSPLPNARQIVLQVLGDDHYKWMPGVTVGVAPKDPHCSMAMSA